MVIIQMCAETQGFRLLETQRVIITHYLSRFGLRKNRLPLRKPGFITLKQIISGSLFCLFAAHGLDTVIQHHDDARPNQAVAHHGHPI